MTEARRPCEVCSRNRSLRFFPPDARRSDGLSLRCADCAKKARRSSSHATRVAKIYGISREDYTTILAAQGGVCAICKGARRYQLDVDHDHSMEVDGQATRESVRGLLCKRCNREILPAVRDSIEILEAVIAYLKSPPARTALNQ